jgi:hypothetical protein
MILNCTLCGRPVAAIEPVTIEGPMVAILKRTITGFLGVDENEIGPVISLLVDPTPESIQTTFKVRCPHGC